MTANINHDVQSVMGGGGLKYLKLALILIHAFLIEQLTSQKCRNQTRANAR
jgi:hypothetical protein